MKAKNVNLNTLLYIVEAKPDDEQIEQYILNFPAAKRKQSEMRKRKIQNAYKEM